MKELVVNLLSKLLRGKKVPQLQPLPSIDDDVIGPNENEVNSIISNELADLEDKEFIIKAKASGAIKAKNPWSPD